VEREAIVFACRTSCRSDHGTVPAFHAAQRIRRAFDQLPVDRYPKSCAPNWQQGKTHIGRRVRCATVTVGWSCTLSGGSRGRRADVGLKYAHVLRANWRRNEPDPPELGAPSRKRATDPPGIAGDATQSNVSGRRLPAGGIGEDRPSTPRRRSLGDRIER
jgi:hypothetical protein